MLNRLYILCHRLCLIIALCYLHHSPQPIDTKFRFESYWLEMPGFIDCVTQAWKSLFHYGIILS